MKILTPNNTTPEDIKYIHNNFKKTLLVIDEICQKHNLRYYLLFGTMIGAKRHQGFIPWDDDADIGMPRKDYEQLLKHAAEWIPEGYRIVSGSSDPNYPYYFARFEDANTTFVLRRRFSYIGGIPIDVFPLDGMTGNKTLLKIHNFKYSFLNKLLYYTVSEKKSGKVFHNILAVACRTFINPATIHRKINTLMQEYDYEVSEYITDHTKTARRGGMAKRITYGTPVKYKFEDVAFCGPEDGHSYLKTIYNDYMTLPSVDKRPALNFRYINFDISFSEYIKSNKKCKENESNCR